MAIIREGDRRVLLVVDMQEGVVRNAWEAPRVIQKIVLAVERARGQGAPVIWVQHSDDELVYESSN